jgi:hypothetical protein
VRRSVLGPLDPRDATPVVRALLDVGRRPLRLAEAPDPKGLEEAPALVERLLQVAVLFAVLAEVVVTEQTSFRVVRELLDVIVDAVLRLILAELRRASSRRRPCG